MKDPKKQEIKRAEELLRHAQQELSDPNLDPQERGHYSRTYEFWKSRLEQIQLDQ